MTVHDTQTQMSAARESAAAVLGGRAKFAFVMLLFYAAFSRTAHPAAWAMAATSMLYQFAAFVVRCVPCADEEDRR